MKSIYENAVKYDGKRLNRISTEDNISFDYNYEVINACFGGNLKDSIQQAIWNPKDGCKVWFPHLAKIKNGRYVSGSSTVNWKNYFEDNGNTIIQMLYPGEKVNDNDKEPIFRKDIAAMHTFMKMDDKDYRYVGTYMLDLKSSTTRYQIVRKIKNSIDLSIWASGHDTSYFD